MCKKIFLVAICIQVAIITNLYSTSFKALPIFSFNGANAHKQKAEKDYFPLSQKLQAFDIYQLPVQDIFNFVSTNNEVNFTLHLNENRYWKLDLQHKDIFSADFRRSKENYSNKKTTDFETPELFTLRGYADSEKHHFSTLTISKDKIIARFISNGIEYYIEPLNHYDKQASENQYVVYNSQKTIIEEDEPVACGLNSPASNVQQLANEGGVAKTSALVCAEMAVAYDQAFKNFYGSISNAEFIISARMNNVAAFYIKEFEIDYKLTEIYETGFDEITPEKNFVPCNYQVNNCTDGSILWDFYEWGEGVLDTNSGFTANHDIATFFTGRGVGTNYGFSFTFGVCNNGGYNWCEENNGYTEARKTNLWIHEIGHTFGAVHSTSNNPTNMMSLVIPSSSFINVQNVTFNVITQHRDSRTCLDNGMCSDEAPISTTQTDVFGQFPFLNNFFDKNNCNGTTIEIFNKGTYAFALVQDASGTNVYSSYYDAGIFCYGASCIELYNLTSPDATYTCGTAVQPTCNDGIQNGNETGVDCGGSSCSACPPSCNDNVQNGSETGIDCGGSSCAPCQPTCNDGIQNGNETGLDCGGPSCSSCPPTCSDGIQNGNETGVDCGGSNCIACPSTCSDGIQNGNETGVDCGGSTCSPCSTGGTPTIFANNSYLNNFIDYNNCNGTTIDVYDFGSYSFAIVKVNGNSTMYSSFTSSAYCIGSYCANAYGLNNPSESWTCGQVQNQPTCSDGIQNGNETGIDCGGSACQACSTSGTTVFSDYPYLSNFVNPNSCNGTTIDVYDFGHYSFAVVKNGASTVVYSSFTTSAYCTSSNCISLLNLNNPAQSYTCSSSTQTPTCTDGIQNGSETGVDCGGSNCSPCGSNQTPTVFQDYPFLNNYVDYNSCGGTSVEVYDFGGYIFALVETSNQTYMYSDFFSGAYCTGTYCGPAYNLTNPNATWSCGQTANKTDATHAEANNKMFDQVLLYPNPANDQITLFGNSKLSGIQSNWKIVNHIGEEVLSGDIINFEKPIEINITSIGNGMYYLMLYNKNGNRLNKPFIVAK